MATITFKQNRNRKSWAANDESGDVVGIITEIEQPAHPLGRYFELAYYTGSFRLYIEPFDSLSDAQRFLIRWGSL